MKKNLNIEIEGETLVQKDKPEQKSTTKKACKIILSVFLTFFILYILTIAWYLTTLGDEARNQAALGRILKKSKDGDLDIGHETIHPKSDLDPDSGAGDKLKEHMKDALGTENIKIKGDKKKIEVNDKGVHISEGKTELLGNEAAVNTTLSYNEGSLMLLAEMKAPEDDKENKLVEKVMCSKGTKASKINLSEEHGLDSQKLIYSNKDVTNEQKKLGKGLNFEADIDSNKNPAILKLFSKIDENNIPESICKNDENLEKYKNFKAKLLGLISNKSSQSFKIENLPNFCFEEKIELKDSSIIVNIENSKVDYNFEAFLNLPNKFSIKEENKKIKLSGKIPFNTKEEYTVLDISGDIPETNIENIDDHLYLKSCRIYMNLIPAKSDKAKLSIICNNSSIKLLSGNNTKNTETLVTKINADKLFTEEVENLIFETKGSIYLNDYVRVYDLKLTMLKGNFLVNGKLSFIMGDLEIPELKCHLVGFISVGDLDLKSYCWNYSSLEFDTIFKDGILSIKKNEKEKEINLNLNVENIDGMINIKQKTNLEEMKFLFDIKLTEINRKKLFSSENENDYFDAFIQKNKEKLSSLNLNEIKSFYDFTDFHPKLVLKILSLKAFQNDKIQKMVFTKGFYKSNSIKNVSLEVNEMSLQNFEVSLSQESNSNILKGLNFYSKTLKNFEISFGSFLFNEEPKMILNGLKVNINENFNSIFENLQFYLFKELKIKIEIAQFSDESGKERKRDLNCLIEDEIKLNDFSVLKNVSLDLKFKEKTLTIKEANFKFETPSLFLNFVKVNGKFDESLETFNLEIEEPFYFDSKKVNSGRVKILKVEENKFVYSFEGLIETFANNIHSNQRFKYIYPENKKEGESEDSKSVILVSCPNSIPLGRDFQKGRFSITNLKYDFKNHCGSATFKLTFGNKNYSTDLTVEIFRESLAVKGILDLEEKLPIGAIDIIAHFPYKGKEKEIIFESIKLEIKTELKIFGGIFKAQFSNFDDLKLPPSISIDHMEFFGGKVKINNFKAFKFDNQWKGNMNFEIINKFRLEAKGEFNEEDLTWKFEAEVNASEIGLSEMEQKDLLKLNIEEEISSENKDKRNLIINAESNINIGELNLKGHFNYDFQKEIFLVNFPLIRISKYFQISNLSIDKNKSINEYSGDLMVGDCEALGSRFCLNDLKIDGKYDSINKNLKISSEIRNFSILIKSSISFEIEFGSLELEIKFLEKDFIIEKSNVKGKGFLSISNKKIISEFNLEISGEDIELEINSELRDIGMDDLVKSVGILNKEESGSLSEILSDSKYQNNNLNTLNNKETKMKNNFNLKWRKKGGYEEVKIDSKILNFETFIFFSLNDQNNKNNRNSTELSTEKENIEYIFYIKQKEGEILKLSDLFNTNSKISLGSFFLSYSNCIEDCSIFDDSNEYIKELNLTESETLFFSASINRNSLDFSDLSKSLSPMNNNSNDNENEKEENSISLYGEINLKDPKRNFELRAKLEEIHISDVLILDLLLEFKNNPESKNLDFNTKAWLQFGSSKIESNKIEINFLNDKEEIVFSVTPNLGMLKNNVPTKLSIKNEEGVTFLNIEDLFINIIFNKSTKSLTKAEVRGKIFSKERDFFLLTKVRTVNFGSEVEPKDESAIKGNIGEEGKEEENYIEGLGKEAIIIDIEINNNSPISIKKAISTILGDSIESLPDLSVLEGSDEFLQSLASKISLGIVTEDEPFVFVDVQGSFIQNNKFLKFHSYLMLSGELNSLKVSLLMDLNLISALEKNANKSEVLVIENGIILISYYTNKDDILQLENILKQNKINILSKCFQNQRSASEAEEEEGNDLGFNILNSNFFFCGKAKLIRNYSPLKFSSNLSFLGYVSEKKAFLSFGIDSLVYDSGDTGVHLSIDKAQASVNIDFEETKKGILPEVIFYAEGKLLLNQKYSDNQTGIVLERPSADFLGEFRIDESSITFDLRTRGGLKIGDAFSVFDSEVHFKRDLEDGILENSHNNQNEKIDENEQEETSAEIVAEENENKLKEFSECRNCLLIKGKIELKSLNQKFKPSKEALEVESGFISGVAYIDLQKEFPDNIFLTLEVRKLNFETLIPIKNRTKTDFFTKVLRTIKIGRLSFTLNRFDFPIHYLNSPIPPGSSLILEDLEIFSFLKGSARFKSTKTITEFYCSIKPVKVSFKGFVIFELRGALIDKEDKGDFYFYLKKSPGEKIVEISGGIYILSLFGGEAKINHDSVKNPGVWLVNGYVKAIVRYQLKMKVIGEDFFRPENVEMVMVANEAEFSQIFTDLDKKIQKGGKNVDRLLETTLSLEEIKKEHEEYVEQLMERKRKIIEGIYLKEGINDSETKEFLEKKLDMKLLKTKIEKLKEQIKSVKKDSENKEEYEEVLNEKISRLEANLTKEKNSLYSDMSFFEKMKMKFKYFGIKLKIFFTPEIIEINIDLAVSWAKYVAEVAGYYALKYVGRPLLTVLRGLVFVLSLGEALFSIKRFEAKIENVEGFGQEQVASVTFVSEMLLKEISVENKIQVASLHSYWKIVGIILKLVIKTIIQLGKSIFKIAKELRPSPV